MVILLWIMVSIGTIRKAATGEIFYAPCLKDLEVKKAREAAEAAARLDTSPV